MTMGQGVFSSPNTRTKEPTGMHVKVYLRSPPDVLAPDLSTDIKDTLPDVELPDGSTVETLLRVIGVRRARPVILVNKVQHKKNVTLHEGDRVDLALPLGGG
jgi:hypothetical protein